MAGSFKAILDDDGRLLDPGDLCSMLDCVSSDVYEACEEMYGMIWWLARELANAQAADLFPGDEKPFVVDLVEQARLKYQEGIDQASPGYAEEA